MYVWQRFPEIRDNLMSHGLVGYREMLHHLNWNRLKVRWIKYILYTHEARLLNMLQNCGCFLEEKINKKVRKPRIFKFLPFKDTRLHNLVYRNIVSFFIIKDSAKRSIYRMFTIFNSGGMEAKINFITGITRGILCHVVTRCEIRLLKLKLLLLPLSKKYSQWWCVGDFHV